MSSRFLPSLVTGWNVHWARALQLGTKIKVVARVQEYTGETELVSVVSHEIISTGHTITPVLVSSADLGYEKCTYTAESYEGVLVQMRDLAGNRCIRSPLRTT